MTVWCEECQTPMRIRVRRKKAATVRVEIDCVVCGEDARFTMDRHVLPSAKKGKGAT